MKIDNDYKDNDNEVIDYVHDNKDNDNEDNDNDK